MSSMDDALRRRGESMSSMDDALRRAEDVAGMQIVHQSQAKAQGNEEVFRAAVEAYKAIQHLRRVLLEVDA